MSGRSISFDRAAEYYDRTRRLTPEASAALTGLLANQLRDRQPTLEIGVGTGLVSLPLHEMGVRMTGVDLSAGFIAEARGRAAEVEWVHGDMRELPWTSRFDAAICFATVSRNLESC